jgi:peptidylprolyl isomerase
MSTQTAPTGPGDTARRRRQALAGAVAGVAIVVILAGVFAAIKLHKSDKAPVASAPAATAPVSAAPSEAAQPEATRPEQTKAPVAVRTPAALAKEPAIAPGGKKALTKLVVTPIVEGTGAKVRAGQTITTNYKLISYQTGKVLDSSWQRGPFVTVIGAGQIIQGWDKAIPGQRVGSRLQLDVPAALGEGNQLGDLRFVVDILAAS